MLKRIFLSLFFGAIAVFSYAPFHFWPLAFISFIGLLWLIANRSKKQAMLLGFTWGIAYFLAGAHWVYVSIRQYGDLPTFLSVVVLGLFVAYLALYPMLFALLVRCCDKLAPRYSFKQWVIAAPFIWQITECLRGSILNGFSWLEFGYTQLDSPLRSYFPIIGIHGVNLVTSLVSGLLLYFIFSILQKKAIKNSACTLIALLLIFFAPLLFKNIDWVKMDSSRSANFTLIQGNISQSLRWDQEQLNKTLDTYSSLTQANLKKSDIIIWSEASITDLENNQQDFLKRLDNSARENNSSIAVGIIDYRFDKDLNKVGSIYNTLLVLGDKKPYQYFTTNRYQKYHLVPFGEYTPFEALLKPIAKLLDIPMSSMASGHEKQKPLIMKDFKFTSVICYEVVLSNLILKNFEPDTDFILTVSNDAWFGDSIGPWQHIQMALARALEFGRPLIFSTNDGITAIIDHKGKVISQLPQFKKAVLTQTLSPTVGLTPYARWGNIPYFIVLSLLFIFLIIKRRK